MKTVVKADFFAKVEEADLYPHTVSRRVNIGTTFDQQDPTILSDKKKQKVNTSQHVCH